MPKTYHTMLVFTQESVADPARFLSMQSFALKEGSASREVNELLGNWLKTAKDSHFVPTESYGVGDLWSDMADADIPAMIKLLNQCGKIYFEEGQWPIICFIDEERDELVDLSLNEVMNAGSRI